MKKFQLEMGGKNPLVVLDDADLKIAVEVAVNGAFFSTGQRCTASSRLIVTEGIHDRFVDGAGRAPEGPRWSTTRCKAGTQIGPVVDQSQLDQDLRYIKIGKDEGAKLAWRRRAARSATRPASTCSRRCSPRPTTACASRARRSSARSPASSAPRTTTRRWRSPTTPSSASSAGICTTSLKYATHFKRNSEAGMVMVNLPTAGVDYHVPFGGRKGSSYGPREQGPYAREFYTTVKTAYTYPG